MCLKPSKYAGPIPSLEKLSSKPHKDYDSGLSVNNSGLQRSGVNEMHVFSWVVEQSSRKLSETRHLRREGNADSRMYRQLKYIQLKKIADLFFNSILVSLFFIKWRKKSRILPMLKQNIFPRSAV